MFQGFEIYLKTDVDLVEDDIRLVLDKNKTNFLKYELQPGIYTFRDLSETVFGILQPDCPASSNVNVVEIVDITMKNKLVLRDGCIAIRFDERSFLVLSLASNHIGILNTIMNTLVRKL